MKKKQLTEKEIALNNLKAVRNSAPSEQIVLGSLMAKPETYEKVKKVLTPNMFLFYEPLAICVFDLLEANKKVTASSVIGKMKSIKASITLEDINVFMQMADLSFDEHALHICDTFKAVKVFESCYDSGIGMMQGDSPEAIIDNLKKSLDNLENEIVTDDMLSKNSDGMSYFEFLETNLGNDKMSGIPTGIDLLDKITDGLQYGDLCILSTLPGGGKSTLCFQIMLNAIANGIPATFLSGEMTKFQIYPKLIAMKLGINRDDILKRRVNPRELESIKMLLEEFDNDDDFSIIYRLRHLSKIKAAIRKKASNGTKLFILDNLSLVQCDIKSDRQDKINSFIINELKDLAASLNVHLIVIAHDSRSSSSATFAKPSDIKDGGDDGADLMLSIKVRIEDKNDFSLRFVPVKLVITKNRTQGMVGEISCVYDRITDSYLNIDSYGDPIIPKYNLQKISSGSPSKQSPDTEILPF